MPTTHQLKRWEFILNTLRKNDTNQPDLIRYLTDDCLLDGSMETKKKGVSRDIKALKKEYQAPILRRDDYSLENPSWELPQHALITDDAKRWENIIESLKQYSKNSTDLVKELVDEKLLSKGKKSDLLDIVKNDIETLRESYQAPISKSNSYKYILLDKRWTLPFTAEEEKVELDYALAAIAAQERMEGTPSQELFNHLVKMFIKQCKEPVPETLTPKQRELFLGPKQTASSNNKAAEYLLTEALDHYENRNHEKVLRATTNLLDLETSHVQSYQLRAESYRILNRPQKAIEDATQALKLNPKSAWALRTRAESHRTLGNLEQAILDATESLSLEPNNSLALFTRLHSYTIGMHSKKIIKDATAYLKIVPNSADVTALRSWVYYDLGQYKKSISGARKAIRFDPENGLAHLSLAHALNKEGPHEEALSVAQMVLDRFTLGQDFIKTAGQKICINSHYMLMQYAEASEMATLVLNDHPEDLYALNYRALARTKLHQPNLAIGDATRSLEIQPDQLAPRIARTEAFALLKQHEKAIAEATLALKIGPTNDDMFLWRAISYNSMGKKQEAFHEITTGLQLNPQSAKLLFMRADAHRMAGNYQEAIDDATASLKSWPDQVLPLNIRAESYRMLAKYELAIDDATASLNLKPDQTYALNIRAEALMMLNHAEFAIDDTNASLEITPDQIRALNTRAESYRLLQQYEKSIEDATKALEIDPENHFAKEVLTNSQNDMADGTN